MEISGSQYSVEELELARWLGIYGEIISPINELVHKDSNKASPVGIGTYLSTYNGCIPKSRLLLLFIYCVVSYQI